GRSCAARRMRGAGTHAHTRIGMWSSMHLPEIRYICLSLSGTCGMRRVPQELPARAPCTRTSSPRVGTRSVPGFGPGVGAGTRRREPAQRVDDPWLGACLVEGLGAPDVDAFFSGSLNARCAFSRRNLGYT